LIYFTYTEMACRCGCGTLELEPGFGPGLDGLRGEYGWPLPATSVCRCPDWNWHENGHENSLHLTKNKLWKVKTCAADVRRPGPDRLAVLVRVALARGFSVGIHDDFVHLDWRTKALDRPAKLFTYR
tara:strand:- start:482 stop:862 length:381 start_codon:yes stop_codon:yes gene_type:complete